MTLIQASDNDMNNVNRNQNLPEEHNTTPARSEPQLKETTPICFKCQMMAVWVIGQACLSDHISRRSRCHFRLSPRSVSLTHRVVMAVTRPFFSRPRTVLSTKDPPLSEGSPPKRLSIILKEIRIRLRVYWFTTRTRSDYTKTPMSWIERVPILID